MQAIHPRRWRQAAGVTFLALASVVCALAHAGHARGHKAATAAASAPDYPRLAEPDGMPTRTVWEQEESRRKTLAIGAQATTSGTVTYNGGNGTMGAISGSPKVVLVFYGSQWGSASADADGNTVFSNDPSGSAPYMQRMLKGLGTNGELWSGTFTQYCDGPSVATGATSCPTGAAHVGYPAGSVLVNVWYDNSTAAPAQATQQQLAAEAQKAATTLGRADTASNRYTLYVIASPTGTHPAGFNTNQTTGAFCAWHTNTSTSYGSLQYINMPYVMDLGDECWGHSVNTGAAGVLDGVSIVLGHEYAETLTDPIPISGWVNLPLQADGEVADECMPGGSSPGGDITMSTGTFAMQRTWSNDTNSCALTHPVALGGQGGLSANPASLKITSSGGTVITPVTITNTGPGELTNVRVTMPVNPGTPGTMFMGADGCTGANLAAGSSCTFNVDYRGLTCNTSPRTGSWSFSITATGSINTITLPATGTALPSSCRN